MATLNIPAGGWALQPAATPYLDTINSTVPAGLTAEQWANQIGAESSYNPNAINPSSGAYGIAQILPSTAANPGYGLAPIDLLNTTPQQQIAWAGQYESAVGVNQYSDGGYQAADLNSSAPPVTTGGNPTIAASPSGVPMAFGDTATMVTPQGTTDSNGTVTTATNNPNNPTMSTAAGATASALTSWLPDWLRLSGGVLAVLLIMLGMLALIFLSKSQPQRASA